MLLNWPWRFGINQKLIALFTAISLMIFSIIATVDLVRIRSSLQSDFLREALASANGLEIVLASGPTLELGDIAFASVQKAMLNNPELRAVEIGVPGQDGLGVVLASDRSRVGQPAGPEAQRAFVSRINVHAFPLASSGRAELVLATPLFIAKAPRGVLEMRFVLERVERDLRRKIARDLIVLGLFILLLSSTLYLSVKVFILNPLWRVMGEIETFASSGKIPVTPALAKDELNDLSANFRQMARTLTEAHEKQARTSQLEAVGQLTGGVAHDFNNLLSVVSGSLQLMQQTTDAEERTALLRTASRAIEHGSSLTQQMLALGRRSPLVPKPVALNQAVEEFAVFARRVLPENIVVGVHSSALDPVVIVDYGMFQNALLNLALNSGAAMPEGGDLLIDVSVQDAPRNNAAASPTEARRAVLRVGDTGSGIAAADLERVFEPFFTTREVGKGSGLGLSMVKGFTEQSDGMITIESTPGVGTNVYLSFPLTDQQPEAPTERPEDHNRGEKPATRIRVLLVEDNSQLLELIALKLRRDGYDVTKQSSGDEALSLLDEDTGFDVIVSDVVMPGEAQGPDVLARAKSLPVPLPVILMSGYTDVRTTGDNPLRLADVFLEKPVDLAQLSQAVEALLNAKQDA